MYQEVKEIIEQAPQMSVLHQESINTVRVATFKIGNQITIYGAALRMGVGKSIVDNAGSGGIFCHINHSYGFVDSYGKDYLGNKYIATTYEIENDDCASSYFRKSNTVITLNSNRRSECRGCLFCPNNLELNSEDMNLNTSEKILSHFKEIMGRRNIENLAEIERITICTGCFGSEEKALRHLIRVYDVITALGFKGKFHYIGSEILSDDAFDVIYKNVKKFMYTFTVECFTNREKMLNRIKSNISIEMYLNNMRKCKKMGFDTNIIYVLGLDPLDKTIEGLGYFIQESSLFPLINIFQPHVPEHYDLLSPDAHSMDYYLAVRKFVEYKYKDTGIRPQSWECYRPLWYYKFDEEKLNCIRI